MPYVKPSDKTTEKLRGWLILNPNKPRKKLDERRTPIPKGACVAGHEDGPFESYHENGRLKQKGTYLAGEWHGPYESYHENGQLQEKCTYLAGKEDGPFESYHENGQLEEKSTCVAGKLDGPFELYHENGQLAAKNTYVAGEREPVVQETVSSTSTEPESIADQAEALQRLGKIFRAGGTTLGVENERIARGLTKLLVENERTAGEEILGDGAPEEEQPPQAEEVEIPEGVAAQDEPEPVVQETVSAPSRKPESIADQAEMMRRLGYHPSAPRDAYPEVKKSRGHEKATISMKISGWIFALFAFWVLILPYITTDIVMEGSGGAQIGLFLIFAFASFASFMGNRF